jgi:hypothetical protein
MKASRGKKSTGKGFSEGRDPKPAQKRRESDELVYAEYEKAFERVGVSEGDQVRWLVNLAQTDIDALSSGDVTNRAFELATFTLWGGARQRESIIMSETRWKHPGTHYSTYPSKEEIEVHQQWLKKQLDHLLRFGHAHIGLSNLKIEVGSCQGRPYFQVLTSFAFEYRAAQLIGNHAHRIRRCGACQRIFLAVREKQNWCSTRCQSRMGTQRFRKKVVYNEERKE